jgi:hypothetical protein
MKEMKMSKVFATYKKYRGAADLPQVGTKGHIYLDKEGACTITLEGAASMSQYQLDRYGEAMAEGINKLYWGTRRGEVEDG